MSKIEQKLIDEICVKFKEIGCCNYCSARFSSVTDAKSYLNHDMSKHREENGSLGKLAKINPCISCLGILQPSSCDNIVDEIIKKMTSEGYESNTFNLAITLPISYQIRSQSFWYYIVEQFPDHFKTMFPFGTVTVGVKEILKWIVSPKIEQKTSMRFDGKSDFIITVSVEYADDKDECDFLFKLFPETFKKNKRRGSNSISRKAVEDKFSNSLCDNDFKKEYPCPPSVPNNQARLESISLSHNSIYIAGRYRKFSRNLPQTPWILGNERKMESSVQELITEEIEKFFKPQCTKFGASGREDVDVRMLGRGRPFTVELVSPRRTKISSERMRQLERDINSHAKDRVSVRHLQIVSKTCLIDLKEGEEDKCKVYEALCLITLGYRDKLKEITKSFPLVLDQSTPIRVLHRRPVACRKRTIYTFSCSFVDRKSPVEGTELFKAELKTQAGTYVKEFVHGDFNRTKPNLLTLTGAPLVDILALDVKDIELDWPPPIEYME